MDRLLITWAAARVNSGLSQDQACSKMYISKPTLINWELGRTEPMFSKAKKLAEIYGVSLDNIKGGASNSSVESGQGINM